MKILEEISYQWFHVITKPGNGFGDTDGCKYWSCDKQLYPIIVRNNVDRQVEKMLIRDLFIQFYEYFLLSAVTKPAYKESYWENSQLSTSP